MGDKKEGKFQGMVEFENQLKPLVQKRDELQGKLNDLRKNLSGYQIRSETLERENTALIKQGIESPGKFNEARVKDIKLQMEILSDLIIESQNAITQVSVELELLRQNLSDKFLESLKPLLAEKQLEMNDLFGQIEEKANGWTKYLQSAVNYFGVRNDIQPLIFDVHGRIFLKSTVQKFKAFLNAEF